MLAALAMGAVGYATQAGLFFLALERMDASLLALVLYTYPAFVLVGAVAARARAGDAAARRSRSSPRPRAPCSCSPAPRRGASTRWAWRWGSAPALAYTTYILVGDRVLAGVPPLALSALVCTGATVDLPARLGCRRAGPELGFARRRAGAGSRAIALVSTVGAVLAFFAGLERVGPSAAAILSTLEPVVTVGLAAAAFGESLAGVQLAGAGLVLAAVVVMQLPARAPGRRRARLASATATSTAAG